MIVMSNTPALSGIPRAPRQPSRRARKLIFRYTGTQKAILIIGLGFSLFGVALMIPLLWGMPSDFVIACGKREVTGQVLRVGEASYAVNDVTPARIHYSYEIEGQRRESYSDTFDLAAVLPRPDDAVQGPIKVEVSVLWPGCSRIVGTRNWTTGPLVLIFLLFPLIGGLMLFFSVRSNRREIRAFIHGVPAVARVVSIGEDTSTTINGRHPLRVAWEFKVGQEAYTGSLSSMVHLDLEEFFDASEVVVLHDPDRPEINTLFVA
jgi:hypothetical protein